MKKITSILLSTILVFIFSGAGFAEDAPVTPAETVEVAEASVATEPSAGAHAPVPAEQPPIVKETEPPAETGEPPPTEMPSAEPPAETAESAETHVVTETPAPAAYTFAFVFEEDAHAETKESGEALNLEVGESFQLTYTVSPEGTEVIWESEDEAIAVVSEGGEIEALAPGNVLISATLPDGKTADLLVSIDEVQSASTLPLKKEKKPDPDAIPQMDAPTAANPTNLAWETNYVGSWDMVTAATSYHIKLLRDANRLFEISVNPGTDKSTNRCFYEFSNYFTESGNYQFFVQAKVYVNSVLYTSEYVSSDTVQYTKPSEKLGAATNLQWGEKGIDTAYGRMEYVYACFDMPGNANGDYYLVQAYSFDGEADAWNIATASQHTLPTNPGPTQTELYFPAGIAADTLYRFEVTVLSTRLNEITNSDKAESEAVELATYTYTAPPTPVEHSSSTSR